MIEVDNLVKYYGTKQALDRVSFTVREGVVMGFLGPNGAGKSTTMKIITGFLSPTEGTAKVNGIDIVENSLEVRKRIGYLPEHPPLYLDMTVKNYLEFTARIRGVPWKKVKEQVNTVVEKCSLQKYYNAQCKSLSKGYRQRVGIAQALIHEPMVLILDEPTIGLDPIQIVEIRELIKTFGGEHTVILSTHILSEVDMTCEEVIIINDGTVVAQGSTKKLRERQAEDTQIVLTVRGKVDALQTKLNALEGVDEVSCQGAIASKSILRIQTTRAEDISPLVARAVIEENLELIELTNMTPTLEQIFIKATMN